MPHGRFRPFTAGLVTRALLAVGAVPVPFTITSAQFLPGGGYGIDVSEMNGIFLDVRFSTGAFTTQNFALSAANQSFIFNFGTIDFEEPSAQGGINPDELDGLGVTARLTFTAPTGVVSTVIATGTAIPGSVSDSSVDYVIDWSPVEIPFGNGGKFRVSLSDMAFVRAGSQFQTATVTLLSLPEDSANSIPEPASVAILGIGIVCVAVSRRRRAKARST
jgi:hypothetical protein